MCVFAITLAFKEGGLPDFPTCFFSCWIYFFGQALFSVSTVYFFFFNLPSIWTYFNCAFFLQSSLKIYQESQLEYIKIKEEISNSDVMWVMLLFFPNLSLLLLPLPNLIVYLTYLCFLFRQNFCTYRFLE